MVPVAEQTEENSLATPDPTPGSAADPAATSAEATRWLSEEEQQTWLAVRQFMWGFPPAVDRQLTQDSGLSTGEYSVLATLSQAPGRQLRAGDAAADLGWERSRLSHLLRRMEAKGLIERVASICDKRGHDVHLTQLGWETIEAAAPRHVTFIRGTLFDSLSDEEQRVLAAALRKVHQAATLPDGD